jgi:hypothetical protein
MKLFLRLVALAAMATLLMGQSSCDDFSAPDTSSSYPSRGSGSYGGGSSGGGSYGGGSYNQPTYSQPNYGGQRQRVAQVQWSQPNVYNLQGRSCARNLVQVTYQGHPVCIDCPRHTTVQYHHNKYACAACPSGYHYDGNGQCRA